VKALLDDRLAPITFRFGFVESSFPQFSEAFVLWRKELDGKFGTMTETINFNAPLAEALSRLTPLTTPLDGYLLVETRSPWSAIFSNGLRVNDVSSPVSYLAQVLQCRGLEICSIPDRSALQSKDVIRPYGAITFSLYGSQKTDWQTRIRHISATNDCTGWEFRAEGEIQPYELLEQYEARKISDRFTPQMLESYCRALGIDLLNSKFYGQRSLIARIRGTKAPSGPAMSLEQARQHLYLNKVEQSHR
jgi:hypothetical protein